MPNRNKPRVHARDHEHGGADPHRIHYEDVGGPGTGGGGIQFDTYPQAGQWLYIETDGPDDSPSGFGVEILETSGNGIDLLADSGGQILIKTIGGGDIIIHTTGSIRLAGLPSSDPSIAGAIWRDGSGFLRIS